MTTIVALIPARAGSKRIPGKNTKLLAGHPLIAYTIAAAKESGVFVAVAVSSDDEDTLEIALRYGATHTMWRPSKYATDTSPDIEWVRDALHFWESADGSMVGERWTEMNEDGEDVEGGWTPPADCFSILRPTSPFRLASTIRRAWSLFQAAQPDTDSLRAVEPVRQHPLKMWVVAETDERLISPLWSELGPNPSGTQSQPIQTLPAVLVQNGSLEIARTSVVEQGTISGELVMPFFAKGHEGFDINTPADWREAEYLISSGEAVLPEVVRG